MSRIAAFAKMRAQPGRRQELVDALRPYLEKSASEPGTVAYALHTSSTDPDAVWFYARFADAEAMAEHQRNETLHPAEVGARMAGLLAGQPDVEVGDVLWDQDG